MGSMYGSRSNRILKSGRIGEDQRKMYSMSRLLYCKYEEYLEMICGIETQVDYFRRHRESWGLSFNMLRAGVRATAERHIAETCAANITRFRQQKYRPVNRSSLSELFISFLEKVIVSIMIFYLNR